MKKIFLVSLSIGGILFFLLLVGLTYLFFPTTIVAPEKSTVIVLPPEKIAVATPPETVAVVIPPVAIIVPAVAVKPEVPQVIFIGVTTVDPLDLSEHEGLNNNILVTFTEAMNPATLNEKTFIVKDPENNELNGEITSDSTNKVWTFNPSGGLASNTLYTITITESAKGVSGNSLINNFVWSFTTSSSGGGSSEPSSTPESIPPAAAVLASINLSPTSAVIDVGNTLQLNASTLDQYNFPIDAEINYTTSNSSIAIINNSGFITAIAAGNVTITGTSTIINGTSLISVITPINPNSTTLSWTDYGPIFRLGPAKAYYPTVLKINSVYHMWYGSGDSGNLSYATSNDGLTWSNYGDVNGSGKSIFYHSKILFDDNRFGDVNGHKYKIWFWNINYLYTINAINYAESDDGINWVNIQNITQDSTNFLVNLIPAGTNCGNLFCGTYGPREVIYNSSATNTGSNPFSYSFVMYYDAVDGTTTQENTALAYSTDGKHWIRYGSSPIIKAPGTGSGKWDAQYVSVSSVVHFGNAYNLWYGGGVLTDNEGIGYAISCDGLNWIKVNENPLYSTTDGTLYRNGRAYTPVVIEDNGLYKMWYSCRGNAVAYGGTASDYAICYATAPADPSLPLCR